MLHIIATLALYNNANSANSVKISKYPKTQQNGWWIAVLRVGITSERSQIWDGMFRLITHQIPNRIQFSPSIGHRFSSSNQFTFIFRSNWVKSFDILLLVLECQHYHVSPKLMRNLISRFDLEVCNLRGIILVLYWYSTRSTKRLRESWPPAS